MTASALHWRENRVRQEIYKQHLKNTSTLANGTNAQGTNGEMTSLQEQMSFAGLADRVPIRQRKGLLHWLIRLLSPWD
jgi:hypothetical protein